MMGEDIWNAEVVIVPAFARAALCRSIFVPCPPFLTETENVLEERGLRKCSRSCYGRSWL